MGAPPSPAAKQAADRVRAGYLWGVKCLLPPLVLLTALLASCDSSPTTPQPTVELGATMVNLQAGGTLSVPVNVSNAGSNAVQWTVDAPALSTLTGRMDGDRLTITAGPDALPQGPIPVTLSAKIGDKVISTRMGVQIGGKVDLLLNRFNAVRSIAGLNPVALQANASMDCWLHGRYRAENNSRFHTEDPTLPYATSAGADCAGTSNLSTQYTIASEAATSTQLVDILFTVPFHAVGMLNPGQQSVGIGLYTQALPAGQTWAKQAGGIRSFGSQTTQPVTFPGDGQTTFLLKYAGGEWPNPLTSCAGFDPAQTGLPLIVRSGVFGDTTATEAQLTVDGIGVEVCAFGSTQYVNTVDAPGSYPDGVKSAQDIARSILRGYGAVMVIPKAPLEAGKTYQARVVVNGQARSWSFKTAASSGMQSLGGGQGDVGQVGLSLPQLP